MLLLSQTFFLAPKRAFLYLGGLRPKLSLKGDAINLHEQWMRFALRLPGRAGAGVPNPMVGAVVVKKPPRLAPISGQARRMPRCTLAWPGRKRGAACVAGALQPLRPHPSLHRADHRRGHPPRVVVAMEDRTLCFGPGIERLRQAGSRWSHRGFGGRSQKVE